MLYGKRSNKTNPSSQAAVREARTFSLHNTSALRLSFLKMIWFTCTKKIVKMLSNTQRLRVKKKRYLKRMQISSNLSRWPPNPSFQWNHHHIYIVMIFTSISLRNIKQFVKIHSCHTRKNHDLITPLCHNISNKLQDHKNHSWFQKYTYVLSFE